MTKDPILLKFVLIILYLLMYVKKPKDHFSIFEKLAKYKDASKLITVRDRI